MPSKPNSSSTPERISTSIRNLADASARINAASDALAKAVAPIDAVFKSLNLGVPTWYQYKGSTDEYGDYWQRCIGYAKVGGRWGLAICEESGNINSEPDEYNQWPFNDAPRMYRIESVEHIPAMLEKMVKEAEKAANSLDEQTRRASEIAASITAAASEKVSR